MRETRSLEQPDLFTPPHHLKVSPADFLLGPIIGFDQIQNLQFSKIEGFENDQNFQNFEGLEKNDSRGQPCGGLRGSVGKSGAAHRAELSAAELGADLAAL